MTFITGYVSEGDLWGRNVPQEERRKRKGVLGEREGGVEVGEMRGRNVPLEEREKERMFWEGEGRAEGMNANGHGTGDPGQYPVLWGQVFVSRD